MKDDPQIMLQVIDKAHKTKYNAGFHYAVFLWLSWSNAQTNWGSEPQPRTSTRPCFPCGLLFPLDHPPQTVRASFLFLTVLEAFSLLFPVSGKIFLQLFVWLGLSLHCVLYPQRPPCLKDQTSQLHHSILICISL